MKPVCGVSTLLPRLGSGNWGTWDSWRIRGKWQGMSTSSTRPARNDEGGYPVLDTLDARQGRGRPRQRRSDFKKRGAENQRYEYKKLIAAKFVHYWEVKREVVMRRTELASICGRRFAWRITSISVSPVRALEEICFAFDGVVYFIDQFFKLNIVTPMYFYKLLHLLLPCLRMAIRFNWSSIIW